MARGADEHPTGTSSGPGPEARTSAAEPADPTYPRALEDVLVTRDGLRLRVRPIRPEDGERLVAFHALLSRDSIYRRYFSLHPTLSSEEVTHLTNVDYADRLALVFEDGNRLVGVGRYDRYPGTDTAEVAFVVADDHQHLGLGQDLLQRLAAAARTRGITTFHAETLAGNREMLAVFRHSGFAVTTSSAGGEVSVVMDLVAPERTEPT